jgi:hypothetical protein
MTDAIETLFDYLREIGLTKNETITSFVDKARAELAELREDRRILKQIVAVCESPSALYDAIEEARDHLNRRTVAENATVEEADSDETI